jgi:paraquat-inducible protein B
MTDEPAPDAHSNPPQARLRRHRFQIVWIIPIVAALIAAYLGYRTIIAEGPLLTLTFKDAQGLEAGQTEVKYKAVSLGTVESIDLAKDNSKVIVKVRMKSVGERFLNSNARYWVERPRLTFGDISGIETLVSGAYIAVDPGKPGGHSQDSFVGLEQPPGVRSDEPGRTYTLMASQLGSITSGSPIFYRDVQAGEVLGYDIGNGLGPIKINIFIRAPFDDLVRPNSRFWNTSGITIDTKGGVLQLQVQSVQAVIAGGIDFILPRSAQSQAPSPPGAVFQLFTSRQEAEAAAFTRQIKVVSYANSDVSGLTPGAPVNLLGIQVGSVMSVDLLPDPATGQVKVRIGMQLLPQRIFGQDNTDPASATQSLQNFVDHGMRVEIGYANYVTGQKEIDLTMVKKAHPAKVTQENDSLVLPFQKGALDDMLANATDITAKVDQMPFKQIGENFNKLLKTANNTLGSAQTKELISHLSAMLASANTTLQELNESFGQDSTLQNGLQQLLSQSSMTLQTLQALAAYLNQHPQAIIFGRSKQ